MHCGPPLHALHMRCGPRFMNCRRSARGIHKLKAVARTGWLKVTCQCPRRNQRLSPAVPLQTRRGSSVLGFDFAVDRTSVTHG
eukprot:1544040-Rhodomonas_salina.1